MRLVITGGHHSSALPIIKKLKADYKDVDIHWIGHKYSQLGNRSETLEYREITALGIPFYNLNAGKFHKTYNPFRLAKIPWGFLQAMFLVQKIRPDVILSFGGYLAVPVVVCGYYIGVSCLTHEQTLVTGHANKLLSNFVSKILISWPESKEHFPREKVVYTGIPLRDEIFKGGSKLGVNNKLPTVYITGGKTGSHDINLLVANILPELLDTCNVIHQCGDHSKFKDFDTLDGLSKKLSDKPGKYILRKYVLADEIGEVYEKSALVVGRSGAHTISELLVLEKPCILIPISWVSHNEQYRNAEMIKEHGLGEILDETTIIPLALLNKIKDMLTHIKEYKLKNRDIKKEVLKDSTKLIIDEIFRVYNSKEEK